jgi:hypothetical protein
MEHIIPESLGNTDYTLPRGWVCDSCNNYFARKLEKPVLDSPMIRLLRSDRQIPNKRRRIPAFEACGSTKLPDYRLMSRFLTKAALEALAFKTLSVPNSNTEIVDKVELDDLRAYTRYDRGDTWPFTYRTLYPVNAVFKEEATYYEVLREFDIFYTETKELYFALAILGVEFVVNFGGPELGGYQKWLKQHNGASPLYKKSIPEWASAFTSSDCS